MKMPLSTFLDINLPYGMKKNPKTNKWACFNREYVPLGWNNLRKQESLFVIEPYEGYDFQTEYLGLTDEVIFEILPQNLIQTENARISIVYFYDKDPLLSDKEWIDYMNVLKKFSPYLKK
jgi:hypothetical protein